MGMSGAALVGLAVVVVLVALGIAVVEPTQAAVAMAIGRVRLAWHVG